MSQDDTVHSIRKRCKKIRTLLRLARGDLDGDSEVYKRENVCFRDAARSLSDLRDAAALLETYDMLVVETFGKQCNRQRLQNVREELQAHKQNLTGDKAEVDKRIAACAETFSLALERVGDWPVGDGFAAYWSASHSDVECGSSKIEADMKVPADE